MLGDPEKRSKYDVLGSDWQRAAQESARQRSAGPQAGGTGARPVSAARTSARAAASRISSTCSFRTSESVRLRPEPRTRTRPQQGEDLETTLDLTLAEAYSGGKKNVALQIEEPCPKCGGSGTQNARVCPECGGRGKSPADETLRRHDSEGRARRPAHPARRSRRGGHQQRPARRPLPHRALPRRQKVGTARRRPLHRFAREHLRSRPRRRRRGADDERRSQHDRAGRHAEQQVHAAWAAKACPSSRARLTATSTCA